MKKIISTMLILAAASTMLFANGQKESSSVSTSAKKIGVSMPTKSLQRWNQDGANMKAELEAAGYSVDLQYAGDNDIPTQVNQVENMVTSGCDAIVIAAIDGSSLTSVLKEAQDQNIPIISYDRLIMNSPAVSYYATFDNFGVGVIQGEYLRDAIKLDSKSASDPAYLELVTGAPDDNNCVYFWGGAMSILEPYIKSGAVVIKSGQTTRQQCSTPNWSNTESQKRMENIISANSYGPKGQKLDGVLCSNDSTAQGVTNALKEVGYTSANFPIVTGQDCDITSVKNMIAGTQSMSVFKDTRTLATKVVGMVDALMKGTTPEINDTKTYDNGVKIVPSYLCTPVYASNDNIQKLLIDSGYYTKAQLGL
ncbi:MAG: sugar-binding protein [Spirochaetaceae bacterium]|nr:sugar-binding protein [Spirochaetaceae bacterium]